MNDSDFEWLQQFARAGNQGAFRDLVHRHIDLVFATALRRVGDPGGAEEISQNVFGILARKAWQFAPDDSLPAWLYKTALLESKSWVRGEMRRRRREQTAAELGTTMKTSDEQAAFNALVPLLDEALLSLREKDRTALLLRFYEKQSMREVGGRLGVSEDAAQKRVQTALERLSQFFHRRGFKTATIATATAALQQTSASVPAVTTIAITGAVLKTAPPALTGVGALLARLASLSKTQTAAVCLLVVSGPVLWQWHEARETSADLNQLKNKAATTQNDFLELQTETDALLLQATNLDNAMADMAKAENDHANLERRFADWKQRTRNQLLGTDYHWSDDSLFVRVPKKIVPQMSITYPIDQPGTIKQAARELLGLSPGEREQIESSFHTYFSALDTAVTANMYQTNQMHYVSLPGGTLASEVFELPALGPTVDQAGTQLQSDLQSELGGERWQIVNNELQVNGTPSLRRELNLDAGDQGQELGVWIKAVNGQYVAGANWATQNSSYSSSGVTLKYFLPGAQLPPPFDDLTKRVGFGLAPASLTSPALAWLQQQAASRLGNPEGQ